MKVKLNKKQAENYLKNRPFIDGDVRINSDGSMTITINLGPEGENKMSKMDLIIKKLDSIENRLEKVEKRLEKVEKRLEKVEKRLDVIESLPTIQQELKNK